MVDAPVAAKYVCKVESGYDDARVHVLKRVTTEVGSATTGIR
jgi:hypothetical protein